MKKPSQKRCGECNVCCRDLKIETPEFNKGGGKLCPHHTGAGCGIYPTRYAICREFLCGWQMFPELDESWRPDRSGVLILQVAQKTLPEKYQPAGHGVRLVILGGEAAINRPGFADYVAGLVSRGVAVYLTAVKPITLVNEQLAGRGKDRAAVLRTLLHMHRLVMRARRPGVWGHGSPRSPHR